MSDVLDGWRRWRGGLSGCQPAAISSITSGRVSVNSRLGGEMGVEKWSRGIRVTLYAIGGLLTILVIVAYLGGVTYLLARCESESVCSQNGQIVLELVAFGLVAAIAYPWASFLTRVLRIKEEEDPPSVPEQIATQQVQVDSQTDAVLSFGQSRVAGKVHSIDTGRHRVTVGDARLRFWGGYALRNGWIRSGDWAAFVYQRLLGMNFVLAFWKGGDTPLRGVGGIIHAFFLALAAVGMGRGCLAGRRFSDVVHGGMRHAFCGELHLPGVPFPCEEGFT